MQRTAKPWQYIAVSLLVATVLVGVWVMNRTPSGRARQVSIDDVLARMTLEQKVGQLVMAGFPGYEALAEANTLVGEYYLGGVMLASRNIRDAKQVANLTNQLQKLAQRTGAGVPLLVAADQEGGYVVRLRGKQQYPGNMALGAAGSPQLTQSVALAIGRELRAVGINMDFAPVVDVNSNPSNPVIGVRSFGESPQLVADMGTAFIAGLHAAGVLATVKHFPGHGDTAQDSHIALPSVKHSRSRLDAVEFYPFRKAIAAGTDAVMTAHVTFPAIEPTVGLPATLSPKVLTGLLREELGFQGLIVTDAMEMKAIVDNFGLGEAAVKAVQAGADIVLVAWPTDWRQALRVVDALVEAVRKGSISETRVNASVKRILAAKERLGIWDSSAWIHTLSASAQKEAAQVSVEAATQAITLVRDVKHRLPLKSGKVLVVVPSVGAVTGAEDADSPRVILAQALRRYLPNVGEVSYSSKPDQATRDKIVTQATGYDTVVLATYSAWSKAYSGQAALVNELRTAGKEPIVVALREPYDLVSFANVSTYLAAYSANPESLTAVAEVLAGKQQAGGKLPVSLPGLYTAGR